jgi:hypothetical protein
MNKLTKLSIFFAVLLLLAVLLEKTLDFIIKQNYDFKPSKVASGTIDAEILIQGPSRAVHGIDPRVISAESGITCYNLGMNASSIEEHIILLYLYLKNNKPPKYVFLEIHHAYFRKNNLTFHSYNYVPFMNDEYVRNFIKKYDYKLYRLNRVPLLKYSLYNKSLLNEAAKGLIQLVTESRESNFINGYQPKFQTWSNTRHDKNTNIISSVYNDVSYLKLYLEFVELAKKNNIEVVLYSAPMYRHDTEDDIAVKNFAYENNLKYLNVNTLEINSDQSLFYDQTHINHQGAVKFSKVFSKGILEIM